MANFILREPLTLTDGTGFDVDPNSEIRAESSPNTEITFTLPQAVGSSSNVEFNEVTSSNLITLNNDSLVIRNNELSASITQTGNFITSEHYRITGSLTVGGILTAEKFVTEVSQSTTIFDSGSTRFGDSIDDTHIRSGSMVLSGSWSLNNTSISEISNDTTLVDESSTNVITENAAKTYLDNQTDDFQTYVRKSFAHTGSYVSVSTASFVAVTASAPSGYTATSEDDFMFFINGVIAEHDALTIEQSGSTFLMQVDNNSIGYELQSSDEIIGFGKFNS